VDPEMRAWREATGRMMNELCRHADRVVRLFCGIPQVLK
jgi:adenosyl cobinamide kinase/adenosyl cobinamide phosphate guanylyltransferase